MSIEKIQKPFLKWVGGKTQIIDSILSKIPKKMENYHEVFLGGGSVLLAVVSLQRQGKITINKRIYAYDINKQLINVYKHIQSNKDVLYHYITEYMNTYENLTGTEVNRKPTTLDEAKTSKESYYYWMRSKFNTIDQESIERSALFMIINKTCFRGMYREGPNGYNVPYGHYNKTPTIISETDLVHVSELIKNVVFIHSDFNVSIKSIKPGDFVYFDPPYVQENSKSFVGYVANGFDIDMNRTLFAEIKKMAAINIKFLLSNAKVELVTEEFKEFVCEDIVARRAINSKKPGSTTTEVLIYN
jgi:DNA adenine methylase